MNKRNVWTRAMAFMLAMVMILTSQTVSSMGGTLGLDESQQQDVLSDLAVGLKGTGEQIVTNQQTYGRIGRVPFDGDVVLTEVPTVNDRQGNPIRYTEITVKTSDGEEVKASDDGTYALPIETCGSHDVSGVDKDAPYYSTYTVDVVYPAENSSRNTAMRIRAR